MIGRDQRRDEWQADERYQQLVELAPDAILIHDGDRIVLCNAAALALAGADSQEQLVGRPIDAFLAPPYLKAVESELTVPGGRSTIASPVRDTFRRLDGTTVEVEVRAIAFLEQGHPAAHLVIRDITERLAVEEAARQMDERLQQAQRMEAVGALAGGVAHEVNNMMGVVLGFSDFLLRDERMPADCLADVREIIKAAGRGALVTRQLLAFSRRAIHRPVTVDLGAVVQAAEPMLRQVLGEGNRLVIVAGALQEAWMDPGLLEQVLVNLALNARDAMPDGGAFTVSIGGVNLPDDRTGAACRGVPDGRYATLTVSDTGVGIDPAILGRVFEPFFTTKPLGQGTGLGLAAADGIVKQHGGCITLVSRPGDGTTFTIFLPVLPVVDHAQPSVGRVGPGAGTAKAVGTVLVVDDEPAVRKIITRSLEESGLQVWQASDGVSALDLIDQSGPPDLVLTDLTMPGMGGAELARRLKLRCPGLPILFMSGYSADEVHRQGGTQSETEIIEKPFSPGALVQRVSDLLSQSALGNSTIRCNGDDPDRR